MPAINISKFLEHINDQKHFVARNMHTTFRYEMSHPRSNADRPRLIWTKLINSFAFHTTNWIKDAKDVGKYGIKYTFLKSDWSVQFFLTPQRCFQIDRLLFFWGIPTNLKTALQCTEKCPSSYQLGNTSSPTITKVKQRWARLVLGWKTPVQVFPKCCCLPLKSARFD